MYYDTKTKQLYATQHTLPVSRGQVQGLRVASPATLATVGIIPAITDAPLAGMIASGGYAITVANGIAHRIPNVITQAEADAIETEAAENEAIRLITPIIHEQPIECPAIVIPSDDGAIGVGIGIYSYQYHASPIGTPEELEARRAEGEQKHRAGKTEFKTLKADFKVLKNKSDKDKTK